MLNESEEAFLTALVSKYEVGGVLDGLATICGQLAAAMRCSDGTPNAIRIAASYTRDERRIRKLAERTP